MRKKVLKIMAVSLIMLVMASAFCACKKGIDEEAQASENETKTVTAVKTSAKASGTVTTIAKEISTEAISDSGNDKDNDTSISDGNNNQATDEFSNENQSSDDNGNSLTGDFFKEEEAMNLKGRTLTISGYSALQPGSGNASEAVQKKLIEIAQDKYNCKIEFIQASQSSTTYAADLISANIAGVKFADIVKVSTVSHYLPLMKAKALIPLDEYVDFEAPIIKAFDYLYNLRYSDGKHYFFTVGPAVSLGSGSTPDNIGDLLFNFDILGREGQPNILDIYEAGQWNWNSFLNIALACTRDSNGDGIIDQWGLSSQQNYYALQHIYHSNGILPAEMLGNGKFALNVQSIKAQKCLQFL